MKKNRFLKKILGLGLSAALVFGGQASVFAGEMKEDVESVENSEIVTLEEEVEITQLEPAYIFESIQTDTTDVYIAFGQSTDTLEQACLTYELNGVSEEVEGITIQNVSAFHLNQGYVLKKITARLNGNAFESDLTSFVNKEKTELVIQENEEQSGENAYAVDINQLGSTAVAQSLSENTDIIDSEDLITLEDTNGSPIVVLDPGHGISSTGTYKTWDGITYQEHEINWKIALMLKEELEERGITVYLTREEDTTPSLQERVLFARDHGAACMVSIHLNSAGSVNEQETTASGVMAMVATVGTYHTENAENSQELANDIMSELQELGFYSYGFYLRMGDTYYEDGSQADYYGICRYGQIYNVPCCIIEHGFLNNESDFRNHLSNDAQLEEMAQKDADGIMAYLSARYGEINGWNEYNGKRYYIQDGKRLYGWQTIDGNRYYFDEDGYAETGTPIIAGKKYWFAGDGKQQYGVCEFMGRILYFDPDQNGAALIGVNQYNEALRLFDQNGLLYEGNGTPVVNGNKYYINNSIVQSGWLVLGPWTMYFDASNGYRAVVGAILIDDSYYLFDGNGILTEKKTGMFILDGKKYYCLENGKMASGWVDITSYWRLYFDPTDGYAAATGVRKIDGECYAFNEDGVLYKNSMPMIDGKKYFAGNSGELVKGFVDLTADWRLYYDPNDLCAAAIGFREIQGSVYYFNQDGIMQKGGTPVINGKKYCVSNDGVIKTGWIHLSDSWILYGDPSDNGAVVMGWQTIDGKKYYFDGNGLAWLGFTIINGNHYYISYEEGMYAGCTPVIDGKKYCFNADGTQVFGWYEMGDWKLYFNPDDNGAAATGYVSIGNMVYEFNEDGILISSNVSYIEAQDPVSGRWYQLEPQFATDPQIGTDITADQFFAAAVYTEAGDQGLEGQIAVALVMLNRVESSGYADSLPYVIYQKTHFAVARDGSLTRALTAFRDNDQSYLQWVQKAQTMEAVRRAKEIMDNHLLYGTPRVIEGIEMPSYLSDFSALYFMTPAAFERLNLDEEACESVVYKGHIFFKKWVKKS